MAISLVLCSVSFDVRAKEPGDAPCGPVFGSLRKGCPGWKK